jgi:hypothetical protein
MKISEGASKVYWKIGGEILVKINLGDKTSLVIFFSYVLFSSWFFISSLVLANLEPKTLNLEHFYGKIYYSFIYNVPSKYTKKLLRVFYYVIIINITHGQR